MIYTDTSKPQTSRSFVWRWVLANMVGLPVLLAPSGIAYFLILGVSIMADGSSVGFVPYVFAAIILAITGAILGGWLGLMQWLVLRKQVFQAWRWISASSLGVAVGAPLGGLVYGIVFATIIERPDGIYFSFSYEYISFGMSLGLSIGVSQWFVMRRWFDKAEWWIIALPLCFTAGMLFAKFYLVSNALVIPIHWLTQRIAAFVPGIENMQLLFVFAILSALIALIGVGLITGFLLDWLLRFQRKQEIN